MFFLRLRCNSRLRLEYLIAKSGFYWPDNAGNLFFWNKNRTVWKGRLNLQLQQKIDRWFLRKYSFQYQKSKSMRRKTCQLWKRRRHTMLKTARCLWLDFCPWLIDFKGLLNCLNRKQEHFRIIQIMKLKSFFSSFELF